MGVENKQFHDDCDELKTHMLNFMRNTKLSGIDKEVIVAAQSISMIDFILENEKDITVRINYLNSLRKYIDDIEQAIQQ